MGLFISHRHFVHRKQQSFLQENRLLGETNEPRQSVDAARLQKAIRSKEEEDKSRKVNGENAAPAPETPEAKAARLVAEVNAKIGAYGRKMEALPSPMRTQFYSDLNRYLDQSVSLYANFQEYHEAVLKNVGVVLEKIAGGVDDAQEKKKKEEQEEARKKRTLEDVRAKLEAEPKIPEGSVDSAKLEQILKGNDEAVEKLRVSPENLENLRETGAARHELQKYEEGARIASAAQAILGERFSDLQEFVEKAQKDTNQVMGSGSRTSTSVIATAAGIGASIGAGFFGFGAIAGAAIGAGIGAIVSIGVHAGAHFMSSEEREQKKEKHNAVINTQKEKLSRGVAMAAKLMQNLDQDGDVLAAAPSAMRGSLEKQHAEYLESVMKVLKTNMEGRTKIGGNLKNLVANLKECQELKKQHEERQAKIEKEIFEKELERKRLQENQEKLKEQGEGSKKIIDDLELRLADPEISTEQRGEIQKQLGSLRNATNAGEKADSALNQTLPEIDKRLEDLRKELGENTFVLQEINTEIGRVSRDILTLESSMNEASSSEKKLTGEREEQTKNHEGMAADLERASRDIQNTVFQEGVVIFKNASQNKYIEEELKELKSVESPNFFRSTFVTSFETIGEFFSDTVAKGLEKAAHWMQDVPVIGSLGAGLTRVAGGLSDGIGEMWSGIGAILENPKELVVGLGALIGRNPKTGEWSTETASAAWSEMGKAMIAYEDWAKGKWGKALGKGFMNVGLLLIGPAKQGFAAGRIASRLATAAGKGGLRATATGVGAGLARGTFEAAIELPKLAYGAIKLPFKAASFLIQEPIKLGKYLRLTPAARLESVALKAEQALVRSAGKLENISVGGRNLSNISTYVNDAGQGIKSLTGKGVKIGSSPELLAAIESGADGSKVAKLLAKSAEEILANVDNIAAATGKTVKEVNAIARSAQEIAAIQQSLGSTVTLAELAQLMNKGPEAVTALLKNKGSAARIARMLNTTPEKLAAVVADQANWRRILPFRLGDLPMGRVPMLGVLKENTPLRQMILNSKRFPRLLAKSSEELAAVAKDGKTLAALGVGKKLGWLDITGGLTGGRSIKQFLNTGRAVDGVRGASLSLGVIQHTIDLEKIGDGFSALVEKAARKKPNALRAFIADFNQSRPAPGSLLPKEARRAATFRGNQILEISKEGGLVVFDKQGLRVRYISPKDVVDFVAKAMTQAEMTTGSATLNVLENANTARTSLTELVFGRPISAR